MFDEYAFQGFRLIDRGQRSYHVVWIMGLRRKWESHKAPLAPPLSPSAWRGIVSGLQEL